MGKKEFFGSNADKLVFHPDVSIIEILELILMVFGDKKLIFLDFGAFGVLKTPWGGFLCHSDAF